MNVEYYPRHPADLRAELRRLPHAQGREAGRRAGARRRPPGHAERLRPRRRAAKCRCPTPTSAWRPGSATRRPRPGRWPTPQAASPYITMFQSRRSLLVWKIYGRRLDGWTNDDFPSLTKVGDLKSLPARAASRSRSSTTTTTRRWPITSAARSTSTSTTPAASCRRRKR